LADDRRGNLQYRPGYGTANSYELAQEISKVQVEGGRAELGKIVSLHAQPVLFRGFNRKLPKTSERTCNRICSLINLLEGDSPNLGGVAPRRLVGKGRIATDAAGLNQRSFGNGG